jgi:hypothetical protein
MYFTYLKHLFLIQLTLYAIAQIKFRNNIYNVYIHNTLHAWILAEIQTGDLLFKSGNFHFHRKRNLSWSIFGLGYTWMNVHTYKISESVENVIEVRSNRNRITRAEWNPCV